METFRVTTMPHQVHSLLYHSFGGNQKLPIRCPQVPMHAWYQRILPQCHQLLLGDKPHWSCLVTALNLGDPLPSQGGLSF